MSRNWLQWPRPGVAAGFSIVAVFGLLWAAAPAAAQDAAPKRKDSPAALKPKEVTLSATVKPAQAKPGDIVTYTVTAKVEAPWHIYAYAKVQPDEGPRATQFDFFDTAGLQPIGGWTPAKPPIRKKEPAFPDLDAVAFYEGEASFSIDLQIPRGASAGPKTLRSQIYFQICNEQVCKPPTYWTVPDATVTVLGQEEASVQSVRAGWLGLTTVGVQLAGLDRVASGQPAKADSNPRFRPKAVTLSTAVVPSTAAPGETVSFQLTAKIDPPWHIYAYETTPTAPGDGPMTTQFDFFDRGGLTLVDDWKPTTPPITKKEPIFDKLPFVSYHEGEVTWTTTLRIPPDTPSGAIPLRCQIAFQICSDTTCLPPVYWTAPEAVVTVASRTAATPATETPPAAERSAAGAPPGVTPTTEPPATQPTAEASPEALPAAATGSGGGIAQEKINQGLLPFLAWSALGGVVALLMPCVWPMIPVTVNFFVKQGQSGKGKTKGLALVYCLSIIAIFTLVGVLFSVIFGASALTRLANNAWLNLAVGLLFIVFGLSLLGLFEISLPSWMLNASAKGESRGGLVGVMFMALTLTITSFTCTFPVVGGLVVMASRGSYLYPVIGLATFATVLALPFFGLALAPGLLKKLPRSGDWMNTIKVIGGLVEIGAALKFLNTAEIAFGATPDNAWLDSEVLLTAWVVLSLICGLYLLGLFKTDHDYEDAKIGPIRLLTGAAFLGLALYLAPALFGYPPQSPIYNRLIVGILPADSGKLSAPELIAGRVQESLPTVAYQLAADRPGDAPRPAAESARAVKATSSDPQIALREEKTVHGVQWGLSYEAAVEEAKATGRPILIDFTGVNCANCRLMEKSVMPHPEIVPLLRQFVTVQLYTDFVPIDTLTQAQREELAEANLLREVEMTNETTSPLYVVVTPEEKVVAQQGGYIEPPQFRKFLEDGLAKAKSAGQQVASTRTPEPARP